MKKESLYYRIRALHNILCKHENYLPKLYKFSNIVTGESPFEDFNFEFDSRYGKAHIITYKENNIYFYYKGDIEIEINRLTRNIKCNNIEDNRIRELELYLYNIFGIPNIQKDFIDILLDKLEDLYDRVKCKFFKRFC